MSRRRQARRAAVATEDSLAVIDEAKLRAAFSVFDTDNSDTLSADELRAVLSKSGVGGRAPFTDEQIQALIDEFDDDGTGELHYAGFARVWAAASTLEESARADSVPATPASDDSLLPPPPPLPSVQEASSEAAGAAAGEEAATASDGGGPRSKNKEKKDKAGRAKPYDRPGKAV